MSPSFLGMKNVREKIMHAKIGNCVQFLSVVFTASIAGQEVQGGAQAQARHRLGGDSGQA
ncbi:MAG: hypothetical protein JSS14_25310 [Proteobacteria bacterium]|nr:hypothetical protein [Pseudomonadota bacterium]